MNRTKSVYCDEGDDHESSLDQKLEYLEKLFITIDEEQSDLFSYLEKSSERGTFDKGIDSDDNRNDDDGMILINEEELGGNLMREQDNEEEGDGMQHNGDSDNDIVPEVDHDQRQEAMSEIIYEDGTAINHDHDHSITYSGDHIDDNIQSDSEDAHEDILINDVIDDVDYPSGSDSTAFVDRMDLADVYDDGILSLGIIALSGHYYLQT